MQMFMRPPPPCRGMLTTERGAAQFARRRYGSVARSPMTAAHPCDVIAGGAKTDLAASGAIAALTAFGLAATAAGQSAAAARRACE